MEPLATSHGAGRAYNTWPGEVREALTNRQ
jgi:hypothetical protein